MTMPTVNIEEHPELDNPLGKARGAVEACETFLAEAKDIAKRMAGKVGRAQADLTAAKQAQKDAATEIADCQENLKSAKAALAAMEKE